ncbi:hypothetical protein [Bradyrhizobium sp. USDA 4520]
MHLHFFIGGGYPMPPEADFSFTIDFAKGRGDPRRVFDAASELIAGFEALDRAVAASIDSKTQTVMVLEDVQSGSLRVILKNVLKRADDEAIKSLDWKKAVGAALLKAKYVTLEFLDNEKASGPDALKALAGELNKLASDTDIKHLPDYPPIHEARLVASLDKIQDAKRLLAPDDRLTVETEGRVYEVNLASTWSPADAVVVPDTRETHSEGQAILGIRKPDLLGGAMWQFSHGKFNLSAPILDERWLQSFHSGRIPLYSGDSIRCKVAFTYIYDQKGELIEQKTAVLEVLEIIHAHGPQGGFDFDRS